MQVANPIRVELGSWLSDLTVIATARNSGIAFGDRKKAVCFTQLGQHPAYGVVCVGCMLGVCRMLCGSRADSRPVEALAVERMLFNDRERGCEVHLCM